MINNITKIVDNFQQRAFELREYIHENPELSGAEFNTSQFITQFLKTQNIEILDFHLQTGVIGLLDTHKPGKTLMIRADIDALPVEEKTNLPYSSKHKGISHSCGHDIHSAVLLSVAHVLNRLRNDLNGKVIFLFQPSEENLKGARNIIAQGILTSLKPNLIIATHTWPNLPSGKIGLLKKEFMASSDLLSITITGKGGHGAHPEDCVDPILISSHVIIALQSIISRNISPLESAVLTIGQINSGSAPNIIPESVQLSGTIRTFNSATREKIIDNIFLLTKEISKSMGGNAQIEITKGTPALENNSQIISWIEQSAKKILGDENVVYLQQPSLGSEDFSEYLQHIPGAMFRIGTSNEDSRSLLSLHHPSIIFDNHSIIVGVKTIAQFAYDYLKDSSLYFNE